MRSHRQLDPAKVKLIRFRNHPALHINKEYIAAWVCGA